MAITLDKFRAKLVIKILGSSSAKETGRFIRTAIQAMQKRKINGYIVIRFIDKVFNELGRSLVVATGSVQCDNITSARQTLSRYKDLICQPPIEKNKLGYQ